MFSATRKIITFIKNFGFKPKFLLFPIIYGFYKLISLFFLLFDFIFYFKISKTKIKKPIFLLAHPRSGTTFLNRFLLEQNPNLKGNYLWEMVYWTKSIRKIVSPFLNKMNEIFIKNNAYNKAIHETCLLESETDDAALMTRFFEGLLPFLYVDAWKKYNSENELIYLLKKNVGTKKHQNYLDIFYKKSIYKTEKRLFNKLFSGILYVDSIIEKYPDSKIIIVVRNPKEVLPSSLSLVKSLLSNFVDFEQIAEGEKKLFYNNVFTISKYYYSELNRIYEKHQKSKNVIFIEYDKIKSDFASIINEIYSFCELEFTEKTAQLLEEKNKTQKTHSSNHKYSIEEFGLKIEDIEKIKLPF